MPNWLWNVLTAAGTVAFSKVVADELSKKKAKQ
jgi:hypothetical protein